MTQQAFTAEDGTRLAYHDIGPPDGRPIVLCHGLCANSMQFGADAEHFAALGYRVLLPDIRGHGASEAPAGHAAERFSLAVLASDMASMLDHARAGPVHWAGNSLGGIIAFQMVESQPELFRSLATFGTAHRLALPAFSPRAIPLLYRLLGRRLIAWSTALGTTANRAARPLIRSMLTAHDPLAGEAIAHHVRAYDLTEAALSYAGPMLLLHCGRDGAVNLALPATLNRFAGRENFTRVDLRTGGHMANLDASDAWRDALLGFWRRVDGQV